MTRIFATVGTTSFDDLVRSVCSLPFLTAAATHHYAKHCTHQPSCPSRPAGETRATSSPSNSSPSSSPSPSGSSSALDSGCGGPSRSSSSTSSSSFRGAGSSSTSSRDEGEAGVLEVVIQYGRGECPRSYIPTSLLGACEVEDEGVSAGSALISIPLSREQLVDGTEKKTNGDSVTARISWYRFKPSLSEEMQRADIMLSHAGAGTLLEALAISSSAKRKVINAVINSKLMDNHQLELAEELERRKHILVTRDCASEWTTEAGARRFWNEIDKFQPVPFAPGGRDRDNEGQSEENANVSSFQRIVDGVMGFRQHSGTKKKSY